MKPESHNRHYRSGLKLKKERGGSSTVLMASRGRLARPHQRWWQTRLDPATGGG